MNISIFISLKLVDTVKFMYIWLNIAIYTHIYGLNTRKRCAQHLYSAFTPRKLVHATPSLHSYGVVPLNFYIGGYSANPDTLPHGNTDE